MRPSFAQIPAALYRTRCVPLACTVLLLAACASLPPPTAELDAAQQALARAEAADADQYAADALASARAGLQRAQAAMARGRADEARTAAVAANADADLARVRSAAARTRADLQQQRQEVAALQARMKLEPGPAGANPLDIGLPAGTPEQRLQALEADPRLNPFAQYERLQARQAVAALATVPRRNLAPAMMLAERRVGIAEQAARIEAARRDIEQLANERNELRVEASRRDADRAMAEAEQLRLQAQIQAEDAARARAQAEQADAVLEGAQTEQQGKVDAARAKEAALARKEAELVAGAKLPPVRQDARGEVFTLAGDAFAAGQAQLTKPALASLKALGIYLTAVPGGSVQVLGYSDDQGKPAANQALSARRAQQVRASLVAAGVARSQVSAQGRGAASPVADNRTAAGRAKNRRVEIVVAKTQ
ncbi:MAG: OmpA family protein [Xanthomonadaceae bacterium]|nr:OmpA family protein [Xanthomonadaceae bacterium]